MTHFFRDKLGEGSYGGVYKGKLQDGCLMAVKVLNESREYLHRGCNTRILHFDIKPHNILLDKSFCPKISNFVLAKICHREKSIISMLGARGTAGYIAPEVLCRNFGGVSHKSDVYIYSYGMMVFEMVRGRSIDRLEQDEDLGLHGLMNEEDHESVRKMIIVSLWCIQTDPSNRPPMSRVVNMFEGSLEYLQVPPKPFLFSPSRSEDY
ncbi:rust resistance kinase Lr10-like [Corylus avellana]|uniref:rust resistance kinase Lr10-like n=1 Tax=Corylus avellana TaxID=13451 RepID=UPI00286A9A19|nr:rust resistance kinase Lr10-like [Corylus avellana]